MCDNKLHPKLLRHYFRMTASWCHCSKHFRMTASWCHCSKQEIQEKSCMNSLRSPKETWRGDQPALRLALSNMEGDVTVFRK